ncbi:SUN domain-containing protein 1-like [Bidens hawaiensis]|uniref:SUN domain-containing protein 1-like n=1 Tax=Bidens hawaiensis TaxID=980011 RepID=UPI004049061C
MSSSAVSITANPSAAPLRRHTTDKKTTSDNDVINDNTTTHPPTKPTSETPKSTETLQTKNQNPNTKLRKRTKAAAVTSSSSRSPWKTAASVLVKNLGLLVVVLGLIQMVRKLGFTQIGDLGLSLDSGHERRIAEVEKLLTTTTKLMQFQIDVVDRKVDDRVSGLKFELSRRIDDGHTEADNKFSELDRRIGSIEKTLSSTDWLSKDEFDRFVEEFKGKNGDLKLDEIRALAKEIVEREIGKHAADGIGRVDYAVASGGAVVVKHSEAFGGGRRGGGWFSGNVRSDAVKMLQPSFGQPGECFPLKGDNGFVEIKLRSAIVPEAITLEHVAESVAFDRSTAPKDCKVWGWSRNEEDTQKEHLLTEFTYDLEKSSSQTFNVLVKTEGVKPVVIDTVRLQFMSNHGSPSHTCIYRVRVHGH